MTLQKRPLKSWLIGLMIVSIVASLQIMSSCAIYGYALLSFYFISALFFFVPSLAIGCELATSHPVTGGSYIWVEKAFGPSWGFFAVCILWFANLIWYPTIFSFIATALAYTYDPNLAENKTFLFWTVLGLFWGVTFLNMWGIEISAWVSGLCAVFGVVLPIAVLIFLGAMYHVEGHPSAITLNWGSIFPSLGNLSNIAILSQVVISLTGLEMALVHVGEVEHPLKTLPKALFYAACLVLVLVVAGPLMIAQVIPSSEISVVSGLLDAFSRLFQTLGIPPLWLLLITGLVFLGNWGNVTAWMISSTRGMHVACQKCGMPSLFTLTNRYHAPVGILLLEGILFSLFSVLLVLFPKINDGYWFLIVLTSQIALLYYWLIFASAVRLRKTEPPVPGAFRIPGKNWGIWLLAGLASVATGAAVLVGFFPISEAQSGFWFPFALIFGLVIAFIIPIVLLRLRRS